MSSRTSGPPVVHIVLFLTIPLLAYLTFTVGSKALELYRLQERSTVIRQAIDRLKDENLALRQQYDYLQSDAYIEDGARRQLGLIKPGDNAVVVVGPSQGPSLQPLSSPTVIEPDLRPNWQKWWDFFFR